MRDILDTEFNAFVGSLNSLARVDETRTNLFLIYGVLSAPDPYVRDHVQPKLVTVATRVATVT